MVQMSPPVRRGRDGPGAIKIEATRTKRPIVELDDLLYRYFGATELAQVPPSAQAAGIERIHVDFGLETDRGNRFALWALMHMLGSAPDLDVAFKEASDRDAARNFMDLLAAAGDG